MNLGYIAPSGLSTSPSERISAEEAEAYLSIGEVDKS
jgi:hypothetical protein